MTGSRPDGKNEISNIIVPTGTPGYSVSKDYDKMGWRASDTHELAFQDARVPAGNLLGPRGEGFHQFLQILDGGRISVAALSVGLAQACYDDQSHYPLMADALADLGEEAAAAHCRQPRHVKGCHVVDWILGRH